MQKDLFPAIDILLAKTIPSFYIKQLGTDHLLIPLTNRVSQKGFSTEFLVVLVFSHNNEKQ